MNEVECQHVIYMVRLDRNISIVAIIAVLSPKCRHTTLLHKKGRIFAQFRI
jgi:hypothetical protein